MENQKALSENDVKTDIDSIDNENLTLKEEISNEADEIDDKTEVIAEENEAEDEIVEEPKAEDEPQPEIEEPETEEPQEEESFVLETVNEDGKVDDEPKAEPEVELTSNEPEPQEEEQDGYVDLMAMSLVEEEDEATEIEEAPAKGKKKPLTPELIEKRRKRKKFIIFVIVMLLLLILCVGGYLAYQIWGMVNMISDNSGNQSDYIQTEWHMNDDASENFPEIIETDASQLSSLNDMIKTWYYNGAPCSSSHVLNVLLIGEDTRGDEILEDETRADAAIIASINTDTKTITLTSILRDAHAYFEIEPGNPETGTFDKINAAMAHGGIDCYINCVERLYKIDIDNYAIVNFDSFESIIDELGGVELEITSAEISEINNHPGTYGDVWIDQIFDGYSGYMKLNGAQALAYCRIRHLDSDNKRADRQKYCLTQIFEQAAGASATTQLKVIKALTPYVHTGFKSDQVLSMANYAISDNWLGFEMQSITVPNARIKERGAGGTYYGAWCWKADFPQDANFLQTILYGKSSITLAQTRVDVLNCNLTGFYSETLVPCYAIIENLNYMEPTSYEITTEETDE